MTPPPQKKLAFIDHSFHKATQSTGFFQDILSREYEVTVFSDDAWQGGPEVDARAVNAGNFDVVILWQAIPFARNLLRFTCKNLLWVPMYDAEWQRSGLGWRALCRLGLKVICFSKALYETTRRFGLNSYYVQYFPEPSTQAVSYSSPRVFFWQRINQLDWPLVKHILAENNIAKIVLRDDPDPGHVFTEPDYDDVEKLQIEIVRNLKVGGGTRRGDYLQLLSSCNVFIAPRLREGIGLSFLEAMALGMCVVGADLPTMNEYISSAENGFLFDPERPAPIDLTGFAECGRRARATIAHGHQQWRASLPSILKFISEPSTREISYWTTILLLLWDLARRLRLGLAQLFPSQSSSLRGTVKR